MFRKSSPSNERSKVPLVYLQCEVHISKVLLLYLSFLWYWHRLKLRSIFIKPRHFFFFFLSPQIAVSFGIRKPRSAIILIQAPDGVRVIGIGCTSLNVVTSAEISPSRRTQRCSMHFLVRISIWNGNIKLCSEAFGESARWADLTIRLVVKANSMSQDINYHLTIRMIWTFYAQNNPNIINFASDFVCELILS